MSGQPLSCGRFLCPTMFSYITKTRLYNFDPLKPHFYTVKLGFTGVYIIFHISAQNIDCRYSLEPPRRGGSNEYPQSMFWEEIWKISDFFYLKIFLFLVVKSIYLNRRVFIMRTLVKFTLNIWKQSLDKAETRYFIVSCRSGFFVWKGEKSSLQVNKKVIVPLIGQKIAKDLACGNTHTHTDIVVIS